MSQRDVRPADPEGLVRGVDVGRLCEAHRSSRSALEHFRAERREAVRQFVGRHWSEEGTRTRVPLNLISLYKQVVGRSLIAKDPRVLLTTDRSEGKPAVSVMQAWCDRRIEEMYFAEEAQDCVGDALFSVGVMKVALTTPADAMHGGYAVPAGTPYACTVDLDDFAFDHHARKFSQAGWMAHRYRVPLEAVRSSPMYGRNRFKLTASIDPYHNEDGDEKVSMLGRTYQGRQDEFEDHVDLWEFYLPRRKLVLTIAADDTGGPTGFGGLLRVQQWLGPDCGPYHVLGYNRVPGNAMPKAPIQDLIDLHEFVNRQHLKMMAMVDRIKEIGVTSQGATEDAERIRDAKDGQIIQVARPEATTQLVFGGSAAQAIWGAAEGYRGLFNFMGGNLELLAGRGPQSKTATQDKLLNENAAAGILDLQETTTRFVSKVLKSLCWYWWHDPFSTMKSRYQRPGLPDIGIERRVTPEQRRRAKWAELDVRVDPYSMQGATPQARLAALNAVVQQTVMPMLPLLQQQGVAFDAQKYLQKVAEYADLPDLPEIVTVQEPPAMDPGGRAEPQGPGMPANTTRNYVRENVSQRTAEGDRQNQVNSALGIDQGGDPRMSGANKPFQTAGG